MLLSQFVSEECIDEPKSETNKLATTLYMTHRPHRRTVPSSLVGEYRPRGANHGRAAARPSLHFVCRVCGDVARAAGDVDVSSIERLASRKKRQGDDVSYPD